MRDKELWDALEESVKLQSHYAELLNMHDGGTRLQFANAQAWVDRLRVLKVKARHAPESKKGVRVFSNRPKI